MKKLFKNLGLCSAVMLAITATSVAQTVTFSFTAPGTAVAWTVPTGVSCISVDCRAGAGGAAGGPTIPAGVTTPGKGARVECALAVTPGQVLWISVGGGGGNGTGIAGGGAGGFNGGGNAYPRPAGSSGIRGGGGGGGGASDIRIGGLGLGNRVVAAGGGGGAGWQPLCGAGSEDQPGGDGGYVANGANSCVATMTGLGYSVTLAGGASTPLSSPGGGGSVGCSTCTYVPGSNGSLLTGGSTAVTPSDPGVAGAGGGGYYGGGGGCWTGGGGGSSYTDGTLCTSVTYTTGYNSGNGVVILNYGTVAGGAILGPTNVCMGDTPLYTNPTATPGGVWSSSTSSVATIGSTTGRIHPVGPGTTTIVYGVTTLCGTFAATLNVTVSQVPTISGPNIVCTGNTQTYVASLTGGTWASTLPVYGSIAAGSGAFTGRTIGATVVSYTMPSGCWDTVHVNVAGISGRNHVCMGDTIELHSSAGAGGMWFSSVPAVASADTFTGVVHGVSMGGTIITYNLGAGCTAMWPVTTDALAPILGRDSICVGTHSYMTEIVGGGLWSSSVSAIAGITFDSGKVSGVTPGIATLSYTLLTGCVATKPITVIGPPAPITGNPQTCPGLTTTLADATPGGVWSSENSRIASVDPFGVVTGVSADSIHIRYTIQPGCSAAITVTVHPLPDPIIGPDIMCPNTVDTMRDSSYGIWSIITPTYGTIDTNGIFWAYAQGTAVVVYTIPTGCYVTKNVTVEPMPVPTITYNSWLNTMFADTGWVAYQWYDTLEGKVPGATSPSMAALDDEWYQVEVTDRNGCKGKSSKFFFNRNMLGVQNVNSDEISIYPNPAGNTLYIRSQMKLAAVITDVSGKQVIRVSDSKQVDVSRLASGLYLVDLYDETGVRVAVRKFTKE